ncbi:hypothetical protein [Pseudaeromonas paramecii]|uniref:Uncharacterized protein n=1 Tax=Pseudaeromonas paramecii TaxID=2138166 RepID=A0ABP8PW53_9GAMM
MEKVSVTSLRRAALVMMLGFSLHAESAQVVSLELSLSTADIGTLVNRLPQAPSNSAFITTGGATAKPLPALVASAQAGLRVVAKDDAAFSSAANTNGWLKGVAAPLLMLAGLLVLGLVRQQRSLRMQGAMAL